MAGVNTGLCSHRRLNQERQGVSPAGPPPTALKVFEERVLGGEGVGEWPLEGQVWLLRGGIIPSVQEDPHDVMTLAGVAVE